MQIIEEITQDTIANKDNPSPAWRREAIGEWKADFGDAILRAVQKCVDAPIVLYENPRRRVLLRSLQGGIRHRQRLA